MVILNEGCSHSAKSLTDEERRFHGSRSSYCDFLPGQVYNIAKPGTGIGANRIQKFVKMAKLGGLSKELTYLIFQVPSPSRQTLYLNLTDEEFLKAPMNYWTSKAARHLRGLMKESRSQEQDLLTPLMFDQDGGRNTQHYFGSKRSDLHFVDVSEIHPDEYNKLLESNEFFQSCLSTGTSKFTYDNFSWTHIKNNLRIPATLWSTLRAHSASSINSIIMDVFESQGKYFKKAIDELDRAVCSVKEQWPNIKIIFLRYEESGMPLIYEFCKSFYKKDVSDYCNKNDITYINEKDFNTEWFRLNNLTNDARHPNDEGAKLIAEKIKQVL